jgi:hypothetical protein
VIAGSPRNIFRYSFGKLYHGGRALNGLGVFTGLPNPNKLRMPLIVTQEGRPWGDKVTGREGKSPDHQLRSLNLH